MRYIFLGLLGLLLACPVAYAETCGSAHGVTANPIAHGRASGSLADILYLGTLTPQPVPAEVPVDSGIEEVRFALSLRGQPSVSIVDPQGTEVMAHYPGSSILSSSFACMVSVAAPKPGLWHVQLKGQGSAVTSKVFGLTGVWLERAQLQKKVSGREGPMMTELLPAPPTGATLEQMKTWSAQYEALAGTKVPVDIAVSADGHLAAIDRFEIRDVQGRVLQTLPVEHCLFNPLSRMPVLSKAVACKGSTQGSDWEFFAPSVTLLKGGSYIYALGKDTEGHALMRERVFY